jgi:hypothetical protein
MSNSPFKIGDIVTYVPTREGLGKSVMTDFHDLVPGNKYRVAQVIGGAYIVPEGYESSPSGGIYWTEFKRDS